MRTKITALALGLLLLVVPGAFAQYGGGGGAQTFTVPTLTVGPGPFTASGAISFTGDFTVGSGAQLFLPNGTVSDPALAFTNSLDSGLYLHTADETLGFAIDGSLFFDLDDNGSIARWNLYNQYGTQGVAVRGYGSAASNYLAVFNPGFGSGTGPIKLFADATDQYLVIDGQGTTASGGIRLETDDGATAPYIQWIANATLAGSATTLSLVGPAAPSGGPHTITLPNATGTVALVDAANIGAGTTSLTTTAATDVGTYSFGAALAELSVSDGTDIARQQIDSTGILIDGDYDNDGSGVVTISTDNSLQSVGLSATQVNLASNNQIVSTALATNFSSVVTQDATTSTVTPSFNVDVGDANTGTTGTLNLNMGTTAATRGLSFSNNSLAINTDIEFDLVDTLNDGWLIFTDVAVPTNVVTYTQRADSNPGFTEIATNGTTTAGLDVESGINPLMHLDVNTATNQTRFSVDSLQGGRFEYLNSGNTAQMWTDNIAFTDAATIGLMTIGITNGLQVSGQLSYTAVESGGGIIIANRGVFSFACVNEADAEVCTSGSPAGTAFAEHSAVDGDSGATMACTPAITPGTNAVALTLACNTSSSAGGTIYWKVESEKDATNVTIP